MSGQLVIEPAKFARSGGRRAGRLTLAELPRVAQQLVELGLSSELGSGRSQEPGASVDYEVSGFVSARGYPGLHVTVAGTIVLQCQRCLEPLPVPLAAQRDIVLVPGADEFAQVDDEAEGEDTIPEVAKLDLTELLEDEVLLALPLAPRHEDRACEAAVEPVQDGVDSPFAQLARLKKKQ